MRECEAWECALSLFRPLQGDPWVLAVAQERVASQLAAGLRDRRLESGPVDRVEAAFEAWKDLLDRLRAAPSLPFIEDYLVVALRAAPRLGRPGQAAVVCGLFRDYYRGLWNPYLTRSQLHALEEALGRALASVAPAGMDAFWTGLESADAGEREALMHGLHALRGAHAVGHLLAGIERVRAHETRAAIVECLEEIADPRSLTALAALRRRTAITDWALSRKIARAIRVIEHQNRGADFQTLLRATPALDAESLLRLAPAPDTATLPHLTGDSATGSPTSDPGQ